MLDILQNPTIGIGTLAALQILALLIGIDVFGNGFSSLLHGRPARGTLVSFAALASLLHCASLLVFPDQGGVAVPYTAVSILLLYAEMREARGRSLAQGAASIVPSARQSSHWRFTATTTARLTRAMPSSARCMMQARS